MEKQMERVVETLINSTKNKKIKWQEVNQSNLKKVFKENYELEDLSGVFSYQFETKIELIVFKHLKFAVKNGEGHGYEEVVSLVLYDKSVSKIKMTLDDKDLQEPHRLWTLYKLAERDSNNVEEILEDIINKLDPDRLPF